MTLPLNWLYRLAAATKDHGVLQMHLQPEKVRKGGKGEDCSMQLALVTWKSIVQNLLCTFDVQFRHGLGTHQLCLCMYCTQSCIPVHTIIRTTVAIVVASTVKLVLVTCTVMAYFVRQRGDIQTHTCSMARYRTLLVNVVNSMQTYVPIFVAAAARHCPSLAVTWTLVTQTCHKALLHSPQSHGCGCRGWYLCINFGGGQLGKSQSGKVSAPTRSLPKWSWTKKNLKLANWIQTATSIMQKNVSWHLLV